MIQSLSSFSLSVVNTAIPFIQESRVSLLAQTILAQTATAARPILAQVMVFARPYLEKITSIGVLGGIVGFVAMCYFNSKSALPPLSCTGWMRKHTNPFQRCVLISDSPFMCKYAEEGVPFCVTLNSELSPIQGKHEIPLGFLTSFENKSYMLTFYLRSEATIKTTEIPHITWDFDTQKTEVSQGQSVVIEAKDPFKLKWGVNGSWSDKMLSSINRDDKHNVHLGSEKLPVGSIIEFTFQWPNAADKWEGRDYRIEVVESENESCNSSRL